jgi:RNA-binding protein
VFALQHRGEEGADHVEDPAGVDREDAVEIFARGGGGGADVSDAGVVHKDVEATGCDEDVAGGVPALRFAGHIERERIGSTGGFPGALCRGFRGHGIAVSGKNMRSSAGKSFCNGGTDAGARAGDERDFVLEGKHAARSESVCAVGRKESFRDRETLPGALAPLRFSSDAPRPMSLSNAQKRDLKARAQRLEPVVKLGHAGPSPAFVASLDTALVQHELVKMKFTDFKEERKTLAAQIAEQTRSELIMQVGNVAVFFRAKSKVAPEAPAARETR